MKKEDWRGSSTVTGKREHLNPLAAVDMSDRPDHGAEKGNALSEDILVAHFTLQEANNDIWVFTLTYELIN